jgi:filamentous hemagglutinin family protein
MRFHVRWLLRATAVICAVFWAILLHIYVGLAQSASPITPSGLNTQVAISATSPTGTVQHDITGGTRAGTNLFHSFGNFNVPNNNIANFLNDTGLATDNILGRVTGGNASSIFGTIQTTGFGSANLFLMNPAGIVFGPNASLNVAGSVTFTTADYLRLNDNKLFHAIPNPSADALLSAAPVVAYGFLGSNPGAITVQGSQLKVPERQGISLIGGNILIQNGTLENGTAHPARLSATHGQIDLATAKSPGEFLQDLSAAPNINGTSFRSYGSAHFASGSTADFSQTGNGKISIRGGQLVLEIQNAVLDTQDSPSATTITAYQDTIHLAPGSSIVSRTFSADRGPDIQLIADSLQLIGNADPLSLTPEGPPVTVLARTNGNGDAGNITLRTSGNFELMNYVQIESTSGLTPDGTAPSPILALGNAGNVDLTSTHGNIRMTGFATWATSQAGNSSGNAGTVTASALEGDIILDAANLFSTALHQTHGGGQVIVTAQNLRMNFGLISADNESLFKTGGITVTLSNNLEVTGASIITAWSVSGAPAGDISLTAKDIVVTQGSIINNAAFASGSGGHLKIVADTLQVTDGAQLSSGSTFAPDRGRLLDLVNGKKLTGEGGDITIQALGPTGSVFIDGKGSGIFADTEGTGAGGAINLSAKTLTIQNGGAISASTTGTDPRATGGSIIVNATDQVTLTNGASITASSIVDPKTPNTGIANAGNISINAGRQLELQNASSITTTTQSAQANGGNIKIQAIDRVRLVDSTISTSVKGAEGSGGNITIDPNVVVLQNSQVIAQAVQGTGGNITITTPLFLADSTSLVSASSQFGLNGTVTIQSPTSNLSESLGPLPSNPIQAHSLLTQRCAALVNNGQTSSFVVAGREQLPADPGGWLTSSLAFVALGEGLDAEYAVASTLTIMPIVGHDTGTVSLRRLTPAGFLMANFADSAATGCHS